MRTLCTVRDLVIVTRQLRILIFSFWSSESKNFNRKHKNLLKSSSKSIMSWFYFSSRKSNQLMFTAWCHIDDNRLESAFAKNSIMNLFSGRGSTSNQQWFWSKIHEKMVQNETNDLKTRIDTKKTETNQFDCDLNENGYSIQTNNIFFPIYNISFSAFFFSK